MESQPVLTEDGQFKDTQSQRESHRGTSTPVSYQPQTKGVPLLDQMRVSRQGPTEDYAVRNRKAQEQENDKKQFDLVIPDTTIAQMLGPDPIPSIEVEIDEIQNELQRKLVSEILCERCGAFPYMPQECKQCHKLYCQACQIQMQGNGDILENDELLMELLREQGQTLEGNPQAMRAQAMRYLALNGRMINKGSSAIRNSGVRQDEMCCPNCNAQGNFLIEVNPVVRNCIDFCEFPHKCSKGPEGEVKWMSVRELQKHTQYDECTKYHCEICRLPEYQNLTRSAYREHIKRICPDVMILCQVCTKDFKRSVFNDHPCLKDFYMKKLKSYHAEVMEYLADRLTMFRRQKELLGVCRKQNCLDQFKVSNQENMMVARQNIQPAKCSKCAGVTQGQEEAYYCSICNDNYCETCLGYNLMFDLQEVENFIIQLK